MKAWVISCGIVVFGLAACEDLHPDYNRPLPNGYTLWRVNSQEIVIAPPAWVKHPSYAMPSTAVPPIIISIAVRGDLVYGETIKVSRGRTLYSKSKNGYYILDTKTHEVLYGLDHARFISELQRYGVDTNQPLGMVNPRSLPKRLPAKSP